MYWNSGYHAVLDLVIMIYNYFYGYACRCTAVSALLYLFLYFQFTIVIQVLFKSLGSEKFSYEINTCVKLI